MIKSTKRAFTLVELIVVIVILAILATIAYLTLSDYPAQARDTKRVTQVGTIFDKMKIKSATKFETFKLAADGTTEALPTDGTADTNGVVAQVEGDIDFNALGEEKSKFNDSSNTYKVKAAKYQKGTGTDITNHYCHVVGVKGELKDKITKSDCPAGVDITLN